LLTLAQACLSTTETQLVERGGNGSYARELMLRLVRWTNETVLRRVLGTPSIANSLCTRLGHGQVERHPYAPDLVGIVLVVAWRNVVSKKPEWLPGSRLTEMEVVVLGIADNQEADDGMDDG